MFNRATKFLLCPGLSEQEKGKGENLDRAEEKPKHPRAAQEVVNSIPLKSVQCTIMQLNSIEQTLIVHLLKALWEMRRRTTHGSLHSRNLFLLSTIQALLLDHFLISFKGSVSFPCIGNTPIFQGLTLGHVVF